MQFAVWLCDNIYYDLLNNQKFLIFIVEMNWFGGKRASECAPSTAATRGENDKWDVVKENT